MHHYSIQFINSSMFDQSCCLLFRATFLLWSGFLQLGLLWLGFLQLSFLQLGFKVMTSFPYSLRVFSFSFKDFPLCRGKYIFCFQIYSFVFLIGKSLRIVYVPISYVFGNTNSLKEKELLEKSIC